MIHLISYGNKLYDKAKIRLRKEAEMTNWFDSIKIYSPWDLSKEFREKYKNILNQKRGAGYWIWKLDIIKNRLKDISDNDFLIYLDAGCSINAKGKERFYEYINLLKNSDEGIISFQMHHIEKIWTTKQIFHYFNLEPESDIGNTGQYIATILIMKKNKKLLDLFTQYEKLLEHNKQLITDFYNKKNQNKYFKDNRHDQSILSLLRKKNGSIVIPDENWFENFNDKKCLKYPFWTTRYKK